MVSATAAFTPAFRRAVDSGKPALIELRTNPEQITTRATIADLRAGKDAAEGACGGTIQPRAAVGKAPRGRDAAEEALASTAGG